MAATPLAERPLSLKVLGALLIAVMLFFVWLTWAFFNKAFVDTDDVVVDTGKAGLNLPQNADVKLRGMIVGEVREVEPDGDGVRITLGMKPDLIDEVPANVQAQIVPKTLFGEKYIALIPGQGASSGSLKAGDVIERAEVPIEVESLLNDLYPLLEAVEPAELSYTLTAVANALEGRGEKLGDTLVQANDYLEAINPDVPQLVDDVVKLGTVSDGYAEAMPEIGRLLENTVVTGNTIVAKRTQLTAFFDEGTRLANTLTEFVDTNADNLEALARQNRVLLGVTADYASTFPCFTGGMAAILPRLDSVLRNNTVHIDLELLAQQPGPYSLDERAVVPSNATLDDTLAADPRSTARDPETGLPKALGAVCQDLAQIKKGNITFDQENPFKVATEVYKLVGVKDSHGGKFGDAEDYERSAVASLDSAGYWSPSMADIDSADQRKDVRAVAAAYAGVDADDVPDAASLLLSPILRGTAVDAR